MQNILAQVECSEVNWEPGANEKEEKGKKSRAQLPWIGSEHNEKPVPACIEDHLSTRLAEQAPRWCQGYSATTRSLSVRRLCVRVCVCDWVYVCVLDKIERGNECVHARLFGVLCVSKCCKMCMCVCA